MRALMTQSRTTDSGFNLLWTTSVFPAGFITRSRVAALPNIGAGAMANAERKTNEALKSLISDLKDHGRSTGIAIWRDLAQRLESSRKNWSEPNLSHISRFSSKKETVLVPGKVLGSGEITGSQTVVAFSFSQGARDKIEASGGKAMGIRELMDTNPNGKGVRIIG